MRFKNEAERLAHPVAGLIPGNLWSEGYRLNSDFIEQFNIDRIDLSEDYSDFPLEKKIKIWHLALLLNQDLAESLIEFARSKLEIAPIYILPAAANLGKLSIINQFSKREIEPLINDLFSRAAQCGHYEILQYFVDLEITPLLSLIIANDFKAFRLAAGNGQLSILKYFVEVASEHLPKMMSANNFSAYSQAAQNGHLDVLKYLAAIFPDQLIQMISFHDFAAFRLAAEYGHLDVLKYFVEVALEQLPQMISVNNFCAYSQAAQNGHLDVLKYFAEVASEQLPDMISTNNFSAFSRAAGNGHLDILKYLASIFPDKLVQMVGVFNFAGFRRAAENGYLNVLNYLVISAPEQLPQMISSCNFEAFRKAILNDQYKVCKYLAKVAPAQLFTMIQANNFESLHTVLSSGQFKIINFIVDYLKIIEYLDLSQYPNPSPLQPGTLSRLIGDCNFQVFRYAASHNHLEVIKYLVDLFPEQSPQMINACNFEAFYNAAKYGHIDMTKYLMELGHEQLIPMINADNFSAFRVAAHHGRLNIIKYLAAEFPDYLPQMISANNFDAFRNAAINGHFDVTKYLAELRSDQLSQMISANNFEAFYYAACNRHFEVMEHLVKIAPTRLLFQLFGAGNCQAFRTVACPDFFDKLLLSKTRVPEQSSEMLNDSDQYPFRRIFNNKRLHMINFLLSFAKNFGYAEIHFQKNEYSYLVFKQVNEFLNRLQREMSHFQEIYPNEKFDLSTLEDNVSEERGLYGYYVLRQLIRQLPVNRYGDEVYRSINCLLSIPSIRQLIRLNATQTNLPATHCYANEQFAEQLAAYKSYHFSSDSECLNVSAKALTFFINEQQNFPKAEIFCETLHAERERTGPLRDILHRLKDFFEMSSKEFYPHSFTSYLADALAELQLITRRENNHYTQPDVVSELETWLSEYLAKREELNTTNDCFKSIG